MSDGQLPVPEVVRQVVFRMRCPLDGCIWSCEFITQQQRKGAETKYATHRCSAPSAARQEAE
jgi:hypothetical protein